MTSVRYLVALDSSEHSHWAFHYATDIMNKHTDELHLITVRKDESIVTTFGMGAAAHAFNSYVKNREEEHARCKVLLQDFARIAHQKGVRRYSF
jgi:hypothetical protein